MLGVNMKAKIKVARKSCAPEDQSLDLEKLKNKEVREKFQLDLRNRFQHLEVQEDINDTWEDTKNTVLKSALTVIGKKKKRKKRRWWNEECEMAMEEKKKYKVLSEQDNKWITKHQEA
ncbi:unnamed protein product, partial [Iphiclides podalirius]